MKFTKKFILASVIAAICTVSAFAISAEDQKKVSDSLNNFATDLLYVLPESATQQNVWADAYIGQLIEWPPHLGAGISLGGSQLNMTDFKNAATFLTSEFDTISEQFDDNPIVKGALELLGFNFSLNELKFGAIPDSFFFPTATIDLKLGGLFGLPFDVGVCAMATNPNFNDVDITNPETFLAINQGINFDFMGIDMTLDYFTLGANLRYALFEGNIILPAFSLGAGYYYTKGSIGTGVSKEQKINGIGTQTSEASMQVGFDSSVIFADLEVSKDLDFITIFLGARAILSSTTNNWAWHYKTENDFSDDSSATSEKKAAFTITEGDQGNVASGTGISDELDKIGQFDFEKIQTQAYLGLSFNLGVLQTSIGACADFSSFWRNPDEEFDLANFVWSGFFSFHIKI